MQLKVNNFRSFDNEEFDFSRINIFIGENSGGKSSLLKFLLALKQTIDSPNESNFKLRGDLTDLGNYKEVIRNKEENRKLEFGFSAKEEYIEYYVNFIEKYFQKRTNDDEIKIALKVLNLLEDEIKTSIYFTLNSTLNNHNTITTEISNNKIGTIILESERNESDNTLITKIIYDLKIHTGCINDCIAYKEGFLTLLEWDLKKTIVEMNPEEGLEIYYKMLFLLYFQNFCLNYIELISFVNPIGTIPKRFYFQEDKKASYKLIDIEKIINILGDPTLSEKDLSKILEYLNNSIRKLGIADELNISKNEDTPVVSLNVKTKGFWSNITDVGYGVSLQIPILFQAILSENYTENGEILLIEQPEVHLHPSLQSRFIETLIDIGEKNKYFIETHSEHIIRKLQIMVKKNENNLKPEDVSIYYFKRTTEKFEVTKHSIDSEGKLNPIFPSGFYDNSYTLVKELL